MVETLEAIVLRDPQRIIELFVPGGPNHRRGPVRAVARTMMLIHEIEKCGRGTVETYHCHHGL